MRRLQRRFRLSKGGQVRRLVGRVEAVPPRDESWWWSIRWDRGLDPLAQGTALSRRQAVQAVQVALAEVLDSLDCYCILSDGENLELGTEYYRVVEIFIPTNGKSRASIGG
jgi:hypothetical protein